MGQEDLPNAIEEPVGPRETRNQRIGLRQNRLLTRVGAKDQMPSAKAFHNFVVGVFGLRFLVHE